jgi:ankyrin repeat protein
MLKGNKLLVNDCDEQRKSPLHWTLTLELSNLSLILVDYGANLNAKDDFARKPYDEALAVASLKGGE